MFYRSEANDLALRLARLYTKREDVAVLEGYEFLFFLAIDQQAATETLHLGATMETYHL